MSLIDGTLTRSVATYSGRAVYPTIESSVEDIFAATMNVTNGTKVPETKDIVLRNGGKLVDATYLYADLAGSSKIAQQLKKEAAAKVIKAYVNTATRILRYKDGEIRSFDGDRVMAIFMGPDKEERAVRAAMGIQWAVQEVIPVSIKKHYTDPEKFPPIAHGIGIDSGEALIIRGGIRDNNDLISIGAAPNIAAKLSDIRDYRGSIFITDRVKDVLGDDYLRYDGWRDVWTRLGWGHDVGGSNVTVWATTVQWGI